jgi:uncharacterized membrane protein YdjX (TVP38/TMEM64 family)
VKPAILQFIDLLRAQALAPLIFVAVSALICLAGPVTIFVVVGGVVFGFWKGLALNMAALLLGSCLALAIARRLGQHRLEKRLAKYAGYFGAEAAGAPDFQAIVLLRLVGMPPFFILNYLLGLTAVRVKTFILATATGILPGVALVTYSSDLLWSAFLADGWEGFEAVLSKRAGPLLAVLAAFALSVLVVKILKKKKNQPATAKE